MSRFSPNNRMSKYFSNGEQTYLTDIGHEYLEGALNTSFILYQVDRQQTQLDSLYGGAKQHNLVLKAPIEIPAIVTFREPENKAYNSDSSQRYLEWGNIQASFFADELKKHNREINYGDFIAYRIKPDEIVVFELYNNGGKYFENAKTFGGYEAYFRTIHGNPINPTKYQII